MAKKKQKGFLKSKGGLKDILKTRNQKLTALVLVLAFAGIGGYLTYTSFAVGNLYIANNDLDERGWNKFQDEDSNNKKNLWTFHVDNGTLFLSSSGEARHKTWYEANMGRDMAFCAYYRPESGSSTVNLDYNYFKGPIAAGNPEGVSKSFSVSGTGDYRKKCTEEFKITPYLADNIRRVPGVSVQGSGTVYVASFQLELR